MGKCVKELIVIKKIIPLKNVTQKKSYANQP